LRFPGPLGIRPTSTMSLPSSQFVDAVIAGETRAVARAISIVEEALPGADELLRCLFSRTGRATVLGVTGPPGAGKSSLVDRLVAVYRGEGRKVGVVAVDPSSAYSGGAILGDRVRMQSHSTDPGVFIRSMATRGHLGGLSRATNDAIDLLDAAGFDPVLVETVGVGQDEVEVVRSADVVAVVLVPGMGDDIQAIKAGILEIADLFVINKSDQPGAERLQSELEYMMSLVQSDEPRAAILRTVATQDEGVDGLKQAVVDFVENTDPQRRRRRRRQRAEARFLAVLTERLVGRVRREAFPDDELRRVVREIAERRVDPYTAADRIVARLEVR
jgi:LAO/AO transport system kinase